MKKLVLLFIISLSTQVFSKEIKILFIGDSLTEGYGIPRSESYPQQLGMILKSKGHQVKIINAGVSGSTTSSGLERLKWQLKSRPDILVISLGANDGLRGIPVHKSKENLEKIILKAQDVKIPTLLTGMHLPQNYGTEYRQNFHKIFVELKDKYQLNFMPFLLEGVARVKELNLADGIHPNKKGYTIVANKVAPTLEKMIQTLKK